MKYTAEIYIANTDIKYIKSISHKRLTEEDFKEYGLEPHKSFYIKTVTFKNNYKADIEVYTRNIGETISIRLRLFNEQGVEMPMLNIGYDIDNDWDFYFKGNHYQVYIKEN